MYHTSIILFLQIHIVITADSKGHATLSSTYCHLYIDKLDIHFHGGASWLYNLFSTYIADDVKHSIEDQVAKFNSYVLSLIFRTWEWPTNCSQMAAKMTTTVPS